MRCTSFGWDGFVNQLFVKMLNLIKTCPKRFGEPSVWAIPTDSYANAECGLMVAGCGLTIPGCGRMIARCGSTVVAYSLFCNNRSPLSNLGDRLNIG